MKFLTHPLTLLVLGAILGVVLSHLFPTRSLYSDRQYIRSWPTEFGGNDRLNLNDVVTMKALFPQDENQITMFLNVVPEQELAKREEGKFETKDIQVTYHQDSQKYVFNRDSNSHKISIHGRSFIVTLNKIKALPLQGISKALEYEFSISELSWPERIIGFFKNS